MSGDALTLVEVAVLVEAKHGKGTELRLRRSTLGWVASAWVWATGQMLAASGLHHMPEDAIHDLLREGESG